MSTYTAVRQKIPAISRECIGLVLICAADTILTAVLIGMGLIQEANPLMAYFVKFGLGTFCVAKMSTVIPLVFVCEWYKKQNPEFVKKALTAGIAAYIGLYVAAVLAVNIR